MKIFKLTLLAVLTLWSGCAFKMSANPVTWTDEREGYHARDVRTLLKGQEGLQPRQGIPNPTLDPSHSQGAVIQGSAWYPDDLQRY